MRILVTGGAGFIGSNVADALLAQGHQVWILDDLSSGNRDNVPAAATFIEGDIRDAATVDAVFEQAKPAIVTHQAAQTSVAVSTREPARDAEVNILGSLQVLQAATNAKVQRLIFASTGGAIYGEVPDGETATIDWPTRPLSPYACSKLAFEAYLQAYHHEYGLPITVLRYANVYGPRQDPHGEAGVVAIFCQRLIAGQGIQINARREPGDPGCVRDYVFVDDVVRANLAAVRGEIELPIVNVCTAAPTTTAQLAQRIQASLGTGAKVSHGPRRAGDLECSVLAPTIDLGPATSLEVGIEKTAQWFRSRSG